MTIKLISILNNLIEISNLSLLTEKKPYFW